MERNNYGKAQIGFNVLCAKLLLSHGALVNSRDRSFFTTLHIASVNGNEKMCDLLLTNGARYDLENEVSFGSTRYTPFHQAGNVEVVKAFIR